MGKVIWVIDDNEIDHLITKKMIEAFQPDIAVQGYFSVREALIAVPEAPHNVSAILLDLDMPILDGWDFLTEAARVNLAIPIYLLSSVMVENDFVRAEQNLFVKGAFGKPLTAESISRIVSECYLLT
jgi:CheY-like chemotaxis protein